MRLYSIVLAAMSFAGLPASFAQAEVIPFSGSFQNVTPPGVPGGRCGPGPVLTLTFAPATTSGVSTLGAFTVSASHCVLPTPPVTRYGEGEFTWSFESGDTLTGTYTGIFTIVPGGARTVQDYLILGGTGRFRDVRGTFQHEGTVVFGEGGVTRGQASFAGAITAVPEPATWAMMMLGFGMVGGMARRRPTRLFVA
jgi:hypothetical protein